MVRLARNVKARRTVARLEELDDYLLKDIGLTRSDVLWARTLPLSCDPVAELAKRADANRDFKRQNLRCVSEGRAPQDGVRDLAPALSAL